LTFHQSVQSATQALLISSSTSCVRVASAAEELAKDERHRNTVEEAVSFLLSAINLIRGNPL